MCNIVCNILLIFLFLTSCSVLQFLLHVCMFVRAAPHVSVRMLLYFTAVIFYLFLFFSFPPA